MAIWRSGNEREGDGFVGGKCIQDDWNLAFDLEFCDDLYQFLALMRWNRTNFDTVFTYLLSMLDDQVAQVVRKGGCEETLLLGFRLYEQEVLQAAQLHVTRRE